MDNFSNFEEIMKRFEVPREKLISIIDGEIKFIKEQGLSEFLPHMTITALDGNNGEEEGIFVGLEGNLLNSSDGKESTMKTLAERLYEEHKIPLAVVLVTEAWVARMNEKEMKNMTPSQHPMRKEVIMVAALTLTGYCAWTHAPISHEANTIGDFASFDREHWNEAKSRPYLIGKLYYHFMEIIKNQYGEAIKNLPNFN